jgi:hypothetical protein
MDKNKPARSAQEAEKFILRMPDGMRDRIAAAAKANNRSMNAECIARLDGSFETLPPSASVSQAIEEITQHAGKVLAVRDDHIHLLDNFLRRSVKALGKAVKVLASQSTPDATLRELEEDLAGAQYFLNIVDDSRAYDQAKAKSAATGASSSK